MKARRWSMIALAVGMAAAGGLFVAGSGCTRGAGRPVLHLYNWIDYVKPELLQRFEREHGCRIVLDTYDSNEALYAKLKAGATGYDLCFPSLNMVQIMRTQGMLLPIDRAQVPNLVHLDPWAANAADDPESRIAVPYTVSYTGIGYRKSRVPNLEESWSVFDRTDLAGRLTMLNDFRETLGAALIALGLDPNSTQEADLDAAVEKIHGWRRNLAKFENEQYKTGLASGEFTLVHGYVGDLLQVAEEDTDIAVFLPKEGFVMTSDCMVIPKGAKNLALAHAFINFMLDPQVASENTAFTQYLCPNLAAYPLMDEEIRNNPLIVLPEDARTRGHILRDLGPDNVKYTRAWDRVKGATP
jgi:spermidine/putrescine transport system substrate-binding protein